jgi:hypothetical protein
VKGRGWKVEGGVRDGEYISRCEYYCHIALKSEQNERLFSPHLFQHVHFFAWFLSLDITYTEHSNIAINELIDVTVNNKYICKTSLFRCY